MARRKKSPRYQKLLRVARTSGMFPKNIDDPLWSQVPRRWHMERPSDDPRNRGVTKTFKNR